MWPPCGFNTLEHKMIFIIFLFSLVFLMPANASHDPAYPNTIDPTTGDYRTCSRTLPTVSRPFPCPSSLGYGVDFVSASVGRVSFRTFFQCNYSGTDMYASLLPQLDFVLSRRVPGYNDLLSSASQVEDFHYRNAFPQYYFSRRGQCLTNPIRYRADGTAITEYCPPPAIYPRANTYYDRDNLSYCSPLLYIVGNYVYLGSDYPSGRVTNPRFVEFVGKKECTAGTDGCNSNTGCVNAYLPTQKASFSVSLPFQCNGPRQIKVKFNSNASRKVENNTNVYVRQY